MKHHEEFKAFEPGKPIQDLIRNRVSKLERRIERFPPDSVSLRTFVEANSARTLYNARLTLDVPGKTLVAKEESHDVKVSINAAFDELERQVEKHKDTLRHERLWKRVFKRKELRREKAAAGRKAAREHQREAFFQLVNPHLEWLDHFIGHLIRYSEAMGELPRGALNPEEVVDEALTVAYNRFLKNNSIGDVRSWLTRLAMDELDAEVNRIAAEREAAPVHIEDNIPETPPQEEVSWLGEEIFDFYQPDEDLKVEDVIPDPEAETPEETLLARESRQCVSDALGSVPDEWRRVLLMHFGEDQPPAKIAESLGEPESEVRRILSFSTRYVRQRLIESGCAPTTRRRAA